MKNFKKISSAIAALALAATMAAPMAMNAFANAEDGKGTIVFEGETPGTHTYVAYKIFKGTAKDKNTNFNPSTGKATLDNTDWAVEGLGTKISTAIGNLITTAGTNSDISKVSGLTAWEKTLVQSFAEFDDEDAHAWVAKADLSNAVSVSQILGTVDNDTPLAQAFATLVATKAKDWELAKLTTTTIGEEEKGFDFSTTGDGYYVIVETEVANAAGRKPGDKVEAMSYYLLGVVSASADKLTVKVKADAPTLEKKIKENTKTSTYEDSDDHSAGHNWNYVDEDDESQNPYGDRYNDTADFSIGDTVPFQLYSTLPSEKALSYYETYKYIFHDELGKEFTLLDTAGNEVTIPAEAISEETAVSINNVFTIKCGDTPITSKFEVKVYKDANGKVHITLACDDIISAFKALGIEAKNGVYDQITVAYDARLNTNAVIGRNGQNNEAWLEYSHTPTSEGKGEHGDEDTKETPHDKVVAFTYGTQFTKVDKDTGENLDGAKFYLSKQVELEDGTVVTAYAVLAPGTGPNTTGKDVIVDWVYASKGTDGVKDDGVKIVGGSLELKDATDNEKYDGNEWVSLNGLTYNNAENKKPTQVESKNGGKFEFIGLDDGEYDLWETKAPSDIYVIGDDGKHFTLTVIADTSNSQTDNDIDGTELQYAKLSFNSSDVDWDYNFDGLADESYRDDGVNDGILVGVVENTSTSELPSTGGIGTTLFYLGGGALVAVAGIALITKKRMGKEAE